MEYNTNRKILFRGIDVTTNKWIYGQLYSDPTLPKGYSNIANKIVLTNTVSQLVKLYDNKAFYEGDIAVTKDEEPLKVILVWIEANAMYMWLTLKEYEAYKKGTLNLDKILFWSYAFDNESVDDLKLIGDIFTTPDLFK